MISPLYLRGVLVEIKSYGAFMEKEAIIVFKTKVCICSVGGSQQLTLGP